MRHVAHVPALFRIGFAAAAPWRTPPPYYRRRSRRSSNIRTSCLLTRQVAARRAVAAAAAYQHPNIASSNVISPISGISSVSKWFRSAGPEVEGLENCW